MAGVIAHRTTCSQEQAGRGKSFSPQFFSLPLTPPIGRIEYKGAVREMYGFQSPIPSIRAEKGIFENKR